MKTQFEHKDKSPGYILWKLTTEWQRLLRVVLSEFKLTHAQFVYLASLKWLVNTSDEVVTQNKLSVVSGIDKMVISETTQKLIDKNLITRSKSKEDKRSYSIALTSSGHRLIGAALPAIEKLDLAFFREKKQAFNKLADIVADL